ncbi:MAG: hypothetical protein R2774_04695 [Saprospiraceae bacterium]
MKKFLFFVVIFFVNNLSSQIVVNLNTKYNENEKLIYATITLKNNGNADINLAGQNYRIYYNSEFGAFMEDKLVSKLPKSYTEMKIVQNFIHQNATGYGNLSYESDLGFLNLSCDYNLNSNHPITIGSSDEVEVCEIVFSSDDPFQIEFDWADENLTAGYATAFNEIAMLSNKLLYKVPIEKNTINMDWKVFAFETKDPEKLELGFATLTGQNKSIKDSNSKFDLMLDSGLGQFVVLGKGDNKKLFQSKPNNNLSTFKDFIYIQFDNLKDAQTTKLMWHNLGVQNAEIFKIGENGSLELIKKL